MITEVEGIAVDWGEAKLRSISCELVADATGAARWVLKKFEALDGFAEERNTAFAEESGLTG